MCGRYASARPADDLAGLYDARVDAEVEPDYNVAPTATVPAVLQRGGDVSVQERLLTAATWGFLRPGAQTPAAQGPGAAGAVVINARVETVAERGLFAGSFRHRRCLLPADGWYEWVRDSGTKPQPYFVAPTDGGVLAMAGIWRIEAATDGPAALRVVVITGAATEPFTWLHDRTPMVVAPAAWEAWLDPATRVDPRDLLVPGTALPVDARAVSRAVNSVANNGPQLLDPVAEPDGAVADTLF